jgi:predicted amino acid-binding ACT domain protein
MPKDRTKSQQLAHLWVTLEDIDSQIINTVLTLGTHLGIEDPDLMMAAETFSEKIQAHFDNFKLQAVSMKRASAK